ncbi:HK97 family phage prohead protease [Bradyrhizobium sp. BRP19]|uniref:HK97 family phage prohead protease n=1 Tax=Bradyrhizobium sp. BRP19 TaxID=2793823 RepID=UPI001CD48E4F|nr:HK97 family phage prohead protease [Bradyrhizobium sp. BRP19]MCA1552055.1 HK97 family phage prohead protease [Bradyrhizobium sp. BRP19]
MRWFPLRLARWLIATADDRLVLHSDQHGLAVRLILRNTPSRRKAYESVRDGHRTALSFVALMHGDKYREVEGVKVKIVCSATLQEISLVNAGASRPAYCAVVKSDGSWLAEDARNHKVLSDGAAQKFEQAPKRLHESLQHDRR